MVGYGLIVRQSVAGTGTVQGYAFTIDSQGGYQFVKYPSTDQNASFTDGTPTILAGLGRANVLKVVVRGGTFELYANGTLLPGNFSDSEYASGQVGLVVTGNTAQAGEYQFTSFSLTPTG